MRVPPRSSADGIHLVVDTTGLKVFGQGEWATWKHGVGRRPGWKKLHLGIDRDGFIVAGDLTDAHVPDGVVVPSQLAQLGSPLLSFTADGAYDGRPVYERSSRPDLHLASSCHR